ncbi:MAG TPA: hypothetical protein PLE99_07945 [Candidatus Thiothrix moscowensis]|uniref:hypothetical protein n=1 Tax=unclassified Thiothrix TaxID=2636184 RepID=UPI0025FEFCD8|nr:MULTISPECIES: hypothetical protein [unclassified Thiothrix]HRJ52684.1 hypothetical protein [Candidatus Thiothrix moscowensis]HRJ92832.1 hypothetical protein [Candidatus Thiothrix moscowensis]
MHCLFYISDDIECHFQQRGRLLDNGLHMDYSCTHSDRGADKVKFDRIQLVRKQKAADGKEHYFRLNIGDDVVRKKVLAVTGNSHLDQLFAAEAKP